MATVQDPIPGWLQLQDKDNFGPNGPRLLTCLLFLGLLLSGQTIRIRRSTTARFYVTFTLFFYLCHLHSGELC